MKMVIIIITATFLQVSAASYGQKVTLEEKNIPLEKLFKKIRTQTGYDFIFDTKIIKQPGRVTLNVKDAELKEVLEISLADQDLMFEIRERSIIISKRKSLLSQDCLKTSRQ